MRRNSGVNSAAAKNRFRLTAEELEEKITERTKVLLISFPNNPTGAIMEKADLEAIREVVLALTSL